MTCKTFTNRSANELHPSALLQLQEQHYIVPCLSLLSWFSLNFMPVCEPNHLDADYQEPKQVCIKESSNFTGTSNALSKRSAPSWASDRLHAVEASCSKPRKDCGGSLCLPSPRSPRLCRSAEALAAQRSGLSTPRARPALPAPLRAPHTCAPSQSRARRAAPGHAAPGEIFQSIPPKAWP